MKKVCMNYQDCSYYNYIEDVQDEEPCSTCPECGSLTVLVPNAFNIKEVIENTPTIVEEEYDNKHYDTIRIKII
jgi:ssDNA-binding Zn-finger/Zn-ribbon topoisomerase 1